MANSILKLTVESSEYDAKLKKAAEGIRHLAEVAHRGGGDLTGLEKAELDYIKALGDMETKSRSASGRLRELSNTYKELTVTYNELNEVEKADEGGKALAASLEKLKQRAQEAQAQMDDATKSLQSNTTAGNEDSSMLSKLADKFTINIDALKLFNIGLKAADGALQVAKDAFFSSEQNVDEWRRIIASSQSLYEGFVTSLNNSDFTGFMSRIDDIVKAAREAYNELDRLGTMRTIQAPQIERQNSENVRMRTMLMTGRYIAPSDGRAPLPGMKTGDLLSPAQIKTLERQLQGGVNTIVKLTQDELDQTGRAIDAYYNKLAKQNGMTMEEFKKGTSSMTEFDQRQEGYRKYLQWRQENSFTDMYGNPQVREGNPYQEFKKWGTFRVDKMGENSYNDLVGLIRQQQQQQSQIYSTIGQSYRTINRAEGVTVKGLMNPGGGSGKKSGSGSGTDVQTYAENSITAQTKLVQELTKQWNDASEEMKNGYLYQLVEAEQKLKEMKESDAFNKKGIELLYSMKNGEGASPAGIADGLMPDLKAIEEELAKNPIKLRVEIDPDKIKSIKSMAALQKTASDTAKVVGSIGEAFNAIEDPAAKVAGTVAQAIANIALGYSQAMLTPKDPISWIAFGATGLAQMLTMISAIHGATGYAQGGIVKGNSYSGDNIYGGPDAMVNAGELVLTRAQQSNLASQLQGGGMGGWKLTTKLAGTDLLVSLERTLQKQGYGRLATWQ